MAHKKFNSVKQTATGGAAGGALTLGAAAGGKYKTLQAAGLADGDTTYARVQHDTIDTEWECVLLTRVGGTVTRTVDSKYSNASGTTTLVNFSAGNKSISSSLLAEQAVTADNQGDVSITRDLVLGRSLRMAQSFATAVQDSWTNDYTLNWLGGDVTITSPIVLQAVTGKFGWGLRLNGAKVTCNFNDATKYAITVEVPVVSGNVLQNINVRNFTIQDGHFVGTTPFAGAIELRCLSNGSWINSFLMSNLTCETHSGWAYKFNGSVFEWLGASLKSTGGIGGLQAIRADNAGNGDFGLPSAMELDQPNFRDGSGSGVSLEGPAFTEPFDLSIRGGYIVTMGQYAVNAPSGITLVDGLGIEFMDGGYGLSIGYRGGVVKGGTRGANPVTGAAEGGPGMRYLVLWWASTGQLVLEDVHYENEGAGTNMTLAKIDGGSGDCYLNRAGDGSDIDTSSSGDLLISSYTNVGGGVNPPASPPDPLVFVSVGDSRATIQTLLNSVPTGGSLVFPGGNSFNFGATRIVGKSDVTLWADGAVTITCTDDYAFDFPAESNWTIRGRAPGEGFILNRGINAEGADSYAIGNCVFGNVPSQGDSQGSCVHLTQSTNGLVINNDFFGCAGNHIGQFQWDNITIDGNRWVNHTDGLCISLAQTDTTTEGRNIHIVRNSFDGAGYGVVEGVGAGEGIGGYLENLIVENNRWINTTKLGITVGPCSWVVRNQQNSIIRNNFFRRGPDDVGVQFAECIEVNSDASFGGEQPEIYGNTICDYEDTPFSVYGVGANIHSNFIWNCGNTASFPGNTILSSDPGNPPVPTRIVW